MPIDQEGSPAPSSVPPIKKNNWIIEIIIVSLILFVPPVGITLMWILAPWKRWVKWLVTLFIFLPVFLVTLIWLRLGSYGEKERGAEITKKGSMICQPVNDVYSKCTQTAYNLSFTYPKTWFYDTLGQTGEVLVGPLKTIDATKGGKYVVQFHFTEYPTEAKAEHDFDTLTGYPPYEERTINGMKAKVHDSQYLVTTKFLVKQGIATFLFSDIEDHYPLEGLTLDQAKQIYLQTVNSFSSQ